MVDPDVLGCLNGDCIAVVSQDLADLQVSHNDVGLSVNGQTDASECCDRFWSVMPQKLLFREEGLIRTAAGLADNGLVRGDLDLGGSRDGSADDNNGRAAGTGGSRELGQSRNGGGGASTASSGSGKIASVRLHHESNRTSEICAYPPF